MNLFNSKGWMPGNGTSAEPATTVDFATLPPILRTLLVTDGTVTKTLEAYFWEPIEIEACGQGAITLTTAQPLLDAVAGEQLWERHVRLNGGHSGRCYAVGCSYLRLETLPEALRRGLLDGSLGIGELLRESALESYRRIVSIGHVAAGHPANPGPGRWIERTYLIQTGGRPAIQVTEFFPLDLYLEIAC